MTLHAPTQPASARQSTANPPLNLRAVILLAGTVRPSALLKRVQRCVLDLPIASDLRLVNHWVQHCEQLAARLGQPSLPVRVMLNHATPALQHAELDGGAVTVGLEQDATDYRGTGGTVRDAVADYADDDYVLIAGGGQLLVEPLDELVLALAADNAPVSLLSHGDGKPAAMALVRCGCLRQLASVGFLDLKEQVLPQLARSHRIGVIERRTAAVLPVRTRDDYLAALRWHHRHVAGQVNGSLTNAFAEDWHCSFAIVEPGATLDASVRVHDSVVLDGARVAAGATIVRSVVGPGTVVGRNARIVDALVDANARNGEQRG